MTNVGTIQVIVSANTKRLTAALSAASAQIRKFGKVTGTIGPQMATQYTQSMSRMVTATHKNQTTLRDFGATTGTTARTTSTNMQQIANSGRQMSAGIQSSVQKAHGSFNTFSDFVDKIRHYVVFSIGVQMVMGLKRAFDYVVRTFMEFEQQAIRTAAVAGRLDAAFDRIVENIKQVGRELADTSVFMATDVVKAMYDFASAGFNVADVVDNITDGVEMMRPVLDYALGQQIELGQATDLVSVALKQFGLELDSTKRVVDVFTTAISQSFLTNEKLADSLTHVGAIAHTFGMQLEETVAATMSAADAGFKASSAGQALRMMLLRLVDPTDKSERALAKLGITLRDIDPNIHSFTEILTTLRHAGFDAATASEMFRARTAGVATALVQSSESLAWYNRMLYASEGITERIAQVNERSFSASLKMLMAHLGNVAIAIGDRLAPVIMLLGDYLREVIVPTLANVAEGFDFVFGGIYKVLSAVDSVIPIFRMLSGAITVLIGLWITSKLLLVGYSISLGIAAKVSAIAATRTSILTTRLFQQSIGYTAANMGIVAYTAHLIRQQIASFKATLATKGLTVALLACPLTWFALAIGVVVGALMAFSRRSEEAEQKIKEAREEMERIVNTFKEHRTALDDVTKAVGDYISVQDEINAMISAGKSGTEEYVDALERKQKAYQMVQDAERDFLSTSEQTLNAIADKNESLADFVNIARQANVQSIQMTTTLTSLRHRIELYDKAVTKLSDMQSDAEVSQSDYNQQLNYTQDLLGLVKDDYEIHS